MTGEQLFDSLATATGYFDGTPTGSGSSSASAGEFITKFGSTEKLTEEQTTILQALTLMNGRFVNDQTSLDRSQILAGVIDAPFLDTAGKVDVLFLARAEPEADAAGGREVRQLRGPRRGHRRQEEGRGRRVLGAAQSSEFRLNH